MVLTGFYQLVKTTLTLDTPDKVLGAVQWQWPPVNYVWDLKQRRSLLWSKNLLEVSSVVASSRSNSVVQTTFSIEDWIQTRGGIYSVVHCTTN